MKFVFPRSLTSPPLRLWLLLCAVWAAAPFITVGAHAAGGVPPLEQLFRPSLVESVSISPDGRRLAFVRNNDNDVGSLLLLNLDTGKLTGVGGTVGRDIYSVFWTHDGRLLYQISKDKLYSLGLYAVRPDNLQKQNALSLYDSIRVLSFSKTRPDRVLAWIKQTALDDKSKTGLVEFDVGVTTVASEEDRLYDAVAARYPAVPGLVVSYRADFDGAPGLATTTEKGIYTTYLWEHDQRAWRKLSLDRTVIHPLAFDPDRNHLLVAIHNSESGSHICRMDFATSTLSEPIYSDARYSLNDAKLIFSRKKRALVGLRYVRSRETTVWFDPDFIALEARMKRIFPSEANHVITDWDEAENRFCIRTDSPTQPEEYSVYDRAENRLIQTIPALPGIDTATLRPTRMVKFSARDGLELEAYVTLPAGVSKEQPAPLIVLPHGGPWVRDEWTFDPEVQFLATRGYIVLQPNYRGSSGYLAKVSYDQRNDFLAMRNDVVDATRSIIGSGLVDTRRIGIMGTSFGGYLSLACASSEPDLYRAAVSLCGVFDWSRHVESKHDNGRSTEAVHDFFVANFGDPKSERERYEEISVFNSLDRLRAPVFLAHGTQDKTVDAVQTRRLAKELRARKLSCETFYRRLGGHGFYAYDDRLAYYKEVEAFLARNLAAVKP